MAGFGVSVIPQLFKKTKISRLILGKGNGGKKLYIRLADLKREEKENNEREQFTDVDLWLDDLKLDLGGKHFLKSPNKDGKYYLLEAGGNQKFLGGKEILHNDTRESTLQLYSKNNPDYIEIKENEWTGFSKYRESNNKLAEIIKCACSSAGDSEGNFPVLIACSPHQITEQWDYKSGKYMIREFERQDIANY